MSGMGNGRYHGPPIRKIRADGQAGTPGGPSTRGYSGRAVVALVCLAVLTLWGGLTLAQRAWRARYLERAAYGRNEVATAVEPLAGLAPPGVEPGAWTRAVDDTRAMLVALTASGLLGVDQMRAIRDDLSGRVARSKPETAVAELAAIWDEMEFKAGPVIAADGPPPASARHAKRARRPARPAILPRSAAPPAVRLGPGP